MDIEILSREENPLLHREDVTFEVVHDDATPSRLSIRDSLAAQLGKDSAEVAIHEMNTRFGMRRTVGLARVYASPDDAREIESEYLLERNKISVDDGESEAEEAAE